MSLDAEAGVDGLDLVAEEPGQTLPIAHRPRRADADGLDAVVDPVKKQIEPPRAEALCLQRLAELAGELAGITGECLRRADRLGKDAAHLDEVGRANRINRLA